MKKLMTVFLITSFIFMLMLAPSWSEAKHKPKGSVTIALTSIGDEPVDPAKSKTNIDRPSFFNHKSCI